MGSVYKAVHIEIEDLVVAVKLLSQSLLADDGLRRRFRDEAAICARLGERSPHIVQIRDYGILEDLDLPYFTMEFLQGRSLQERIYERVPIELAISIAWQICEGLQVAHEAGIVHRDLKPGNIYLIRDPRLGEKVKILDFGIARIVQDAAVAAQGRMATQGYLGTPQYSSPEQLRGQGVDGRSDIYSLGMILYELFAGVCPFAVEDQSFGTWYQIHTEALPSTMSAANPRALVPNAIEQVILRCLAKKPSERPASPLEIIEQLRTAVERPETRIAASLPLTRPPATGFVLAPEQLARLENQLAKLVGPIAPTLIRQALGSAANAGELVELLSAQLSESQRQAFSQKALAQLAATSTLPSLPPTATSLPPNPPSQPGVDPAFVQRCERELSLLVGPIATFLIQNALKGAPASPAHLVDRLAGEIGDERKAAQFRQKLL